MKDKPYRIRDNKVEIPDLPEDESLLSLFDETNQDVNLFNIVDEEIIRLGGSKVEYFRYRTQENFDDVYLEERNKIIENSPVTLWCHYDPTVLEESLGEFGLELINDQVFVFNKSYALRSLGRLPQPGDIIKPLFQRQRYEIFEVQEDSFELYGVYHLNCSARLLRDSEDVQPDVEMDNEDTPGATFFDEDDIR
jgi:hypothetical protein